MSGPDRRTEEIERLRHRTREVEREIRQAERIRKSLTIERDIEAALSNDRLNLSKEEVRHTWLADYESDVRSVLNKEAGDTSWLDVVGDIMDEMRGRVSETRTNSAADKSEIDLQSILGIIEEDVSNLGLLCAELLEKFFNHQIAVEKEKRSRQKAVSEVSAAAESPTDNGGNIDVIANKEPNAGKELEIKTEAENVMASEESKNAEKCHHETRVGQSTGDHQSGETANEADKTPKNDAMEPEQSTGDFQPKETDGAGNDEGAKDEKYVQFTIVDENNQPLGGASSARETEGAGLSTMNGQGNNDLGSSSPMPPSPVNASPWPAIGFSAPWPAPNIESSGGQEVSLSNNGQIWVQVTNLMMDQERTSDDPPPNVYEIVNTFLLSSNEVVSSDNSVVSSEMDNNEC